MKNITTHKITFFAVTFLVGIFVFIGLAMPVTVVTLFDVSFKITGYQNIPNGNFECIFLLVCAILTIYVSIFAFFFTENETFEFWNILMLILNLISAIIYLAYGISEARKNYANTNTYILLIIDVVILITYFIVINVIPNKIVYEKKSRQNTTDIAINNNSTK